ncbi:hydantoinase/oxoprolinase family protein [Pseudooceanicola sp. CBS1P-1]|uniref:Hydantoinase/oxoprolinase family protein n=1 Tax=Pseudooceanicola albus TaxID=2692189 RepID=A0A6L7GAL1_9RHOB|nr:MULTISPECIES: hydantoinase/oxoprolinase family protein [Pseudooceanicola]MBT9386596.1 hydantoinase/oxoprolinase family protein [Pseudooceanicola endophyticus]MXN20712.1 hydantoinase/oxoprolinase family protein [Pseudooceanicola albus]
MHASSDETFRIGIDVGGTFTDLVFAGSAGSLLTRKVPTTPSEYGRGIVGGIAAVLTDEGIAADRVESVVHATTVATNTILEGRGAKAALITTKGFRDVLEFRRLRIPQMYTLSFKRPEPLVPRNLRFELDERLSGAGEVVTPLSLGEVDALAVRLACEGVEAVAICLINSYANKTHEIAVTERLRERLPDVFITASADLLPEIREYERTSTTVVNAYLGPVLTRYFDSLTASLRGIGVVSPVQVMKSDGGVMSVQAASLKPAYIVESGPSAGVIGAADLARSKNLPDLITLDMGGTTAKAAMVEGGKVSKTSDYEVGAGINLSSRLVMGGGHALKLPVIDISEIGAGGGSIVGFDRAGAMTVGPQSAGADPGPVAYDAGGENPTLTDAMILLGFINPDYLVGGALKLNSALAEEVMRDKVIDVVGTSLEEAAHGIFQISAGTMVRAVKAVSTFRGRDPRDFSLFAIGGNGPVLAAEIAEALEMKRVVIPLNPGVFSAYGLLRTPIEQEMAQSCLGAVDAEGADMLNAVYGRLEAELLELMAEEGCPAETVVLSRQADLRYIGQAHELSVPVTTQPDGQVDIDAMRAAFHAEHRQTYGHAIENSQIQSVNLRVVGTVPLDQAAQIDMGGALRHDGALPAPRRVYFGATHGFHETPILRRASLGEAPSDGPLIIEEYDTTCVVPPNWAAACDAGGNIVLTRKEAQQ